MVIIVKIKTSFYRLGDQVLLGIIKRPKETHFCRYEPSKVTEINTRKVLRNFLSFSIVVQPLI